MPLRPVVALLTFCCLFAPGQASPGQAARGDADQSTSANVTVCLTYGASSPLCASKLLTAEQLAASAPSLLEKMQTLAVVTVSSRGYWSVILGGGVSD